MKIILASNSPRRKELLARDGYEFKVLPANNEEIIDTAESPENNVKRLAYLKAQDIFQHHRDAIIIGADTIVVFNNEIYGKPKNNDDARRMLRNLSGHTHEVMTGVAIISKDKVINDVVISKVTFKNLDDQDIEDYLQTNEPLDKAGAYAIQGIGRRYIASYSGEFDNIVGLPMEFVNRSFKELMKKEL